MDCVVNLVVVVKWWILLKFFGLCTKDVRCWIENVWFKSALTARLHSTSTPGVFLYIFLYNGDHFTLIDWIMMSCSYWKTVFLYIKLKTEAPSTPSVPRSSQFSRKMSFHAKWINFLLIFDWTNIHTNKLLRLLWQAQQRTREVHQHIMPSFFELFYWKCRDNWEFPLRNADFLFKNGRLFCNSRCYQSRRWVLGQFAGMKDKTRNALSGLTWSWSMWTRTAAPINDDVAHARLLSMMT